MSNFWRFCWLRAPVCVCVSVNVRVRVWPGVLQCVRVRACVFDAAKIRASRHLTHGEQANDVGWMDGRTDKEAGQGGRRREVAPGPAACVGYLEMGRPLGQYECAKAMS